MIARTLSPARWLLGLSICVAAFAIGPAVAHAAYSAASHDCDGGANCANRHIGDLGDNVMTVQPAAGGKVQFSESSPGASIGYYDDQDVGCSLTSSTTVVCEPATGTGSSYVQPSNGNDTVILKPGATGIQRVYGYPGDDTIHANDGNVQTVISCDLPAANSGTADVAYIDTNDPEPLYCETVIRGGTTGGGAGGGGSGGGGGVVTPPPPDRAGPVITGPSTAPATTERKGKFAFAVGPFSESVTGTVAVVSKPIRSGGKKTKIKLAAKAFTVAAGKKARVAFKLTKKQRKLLAKARKVKMTATVTARDALGNTSRRKVGFQLKASRKRR